MWSPSGERNRRTGPTDSAGPERVCAVSEPAEIGKGCGQGFHIETAEPRDTETSGAGDTEDGDQPDATERQTQDQEHHSADAWHC
ncbi:hypothetical protein GCM10009657_09520 [Oryzihumus leptocrescens]